MLAAQSLQINDSSFIINYKNMNGALLIILLGVLYYFYSTNWHLTFELGYSFLVAAGLILLGLVLELRKH